MTNIDSMAWGDQSETTTSSSGWSWSPAETRAPNDYAELDDQIARSTPDSPTLLKWAGRVSNQPPASWREEQGNPFAEDKD